MEGRKGNNGGTFTIDVVDKDYGIFKIKECKWKVAIERGLQLGGNLWFRVVY